VKLWDVAVGRELATFRTDADSVTAVAFSPDGKTVVVGTGSKGLKWWNVVTGQEHGSPKRDWPSVTAVAFSPDGKTLAVSLEDNLKDNTVYLADPTTGKIRTTLLSHGARVPSLVFSPDSQLLAAFCEAHEDMGGGMVIPGGGTVILWDVATGKKRATLQHTHQVGAVAFHPDGKLLATGSGGLRSGEVKLWEVPPRAEEPRPDGRP
jgi:WD40 repeat protein